MACAASWPLTAPDAVPDNAIDIRSKRDLLTLAEVLDSETYQVKRTTFVYLDKEDDPWFGLVVGKRKQDVTLEEIKESLRRVSDTAFPKAYPSLTTCAKEDLVDSHIKRPKFLLLDDQEEAVLLPQMFLDEVRVLEHLKQHPHPNIIRYYGCKVKYGRVTGIVLERHDISLQYYFRDTGVTPDVQSFLRDIHAGIEHLHSLGLAHNDLNPSNILVDRGNKAVIIDLGSCRKFGERLVSAGTPGWVDEDYETSQRRNDEVALRRIEEWLRAQEVLSQIPPDTYNDD